MINRVSEDILSENVLVLNTGGTGDEENPDQISVEYEHASSDSDLEETETGEFEEFERDANGHQSETDIIYI